MDELELDIDGLYLTMHRTIRITNYRTIGLELVRVQVRGELGWTESKLLIILIINKTTKMTAEDDNIWSLYRHQDLQIILQRRTSVLDLETVSSQAHQAIAFHHEPRLHTMSEKQLITNQCYTRCHRKTAQWHFEPSHFITNQGLRSFSKSDKSLDWSRSIYSCQTRSIQSGEKEHAESQIFLVAVGVVILSSAKSAADYALFYK